LEINAEVLVVFGVGIGKLVRAALDGDRLGQLEDLFAGRRPVMKIEQRRPVRVRFIAPVAHESKNVRLKHLIEIRKMKNEAPNRIAHESIQSGCDAVNGEREVVIGRHSPVAVQREPEGAQPVRLHNERRIARGERIPQASGEIKHLCAVHLNRELIPGVENPLDVEPDAAAANACDDLI